MNAFVELFFHLDQANKTNDKLEALETFFRQASPSDCLWMLALLTGRQSKRVIGHRYLKEWIIEKTQLPEWLFAETYHFVGNLAETLALLLLPQNQPSSSSLTQWMTFIQDLRQRTLSEKKTAILALWDQLDVRERLVFNKLLTGGVRLGIAQPLVIRALSIVTGIEPAVLTHHLMGEWHLTKLTSLFYLSSERERGGKRKKMF